MRANDEPGILELFISGAKVTQVISKENVRRYRVGKIENEEYDVVRTYFFKTNGVDYEIHCGPECWLKVQGRRVASGYEDVSRELLRLTNRNLSIMEEAFSFTPKTCPRCGSKFIRVVEQDSSLVYECVSEPGAENIGTVHLNNFILARETQSKIKK